MRHLLTQPLAKDPSRSRTYLVNPRYDRVLFTFLAERYQGTYNCTPFVGLRAPDRVQVYAPDGESWCADLLDFLKLYTILESFSGTWPRPETAANGTATGSGHALTFGKSDGVYLARRRLYRAAAVQTYQPVHITRPGAKPLHAGPGDWIVTLNLPGESYHEDLNHLDAYVCDAGTFRRIYRLARELTQQVWLGQPGAAAAAR